MYNFVANLQVGYSALFAASENGHTDVVDLLVRAGADVNLATEVILTVQNTLRLLLIAGKNSVLECLWISQILISGLACAALNYCALYACTVHTTNVTAGDGSACTFLRHSSTCAHALQR